MSKHKNFCLLLFTATALTTTAGCSTPKLSESLYRTSEVGVTKVVERCRVTAVREILIRDEPEDAQAGGMFGAIMGGMIGGTLGSKVGDGYGNLLATQAGIGAGALAGGVAGTKLADKMSERIGVEYSIIKANGEESTHVQELLPTDRILAVNETCRVQISYDGKNRVLPAEDLPDSVYAPKTTKVMPLPK